MFLLNADEFIYKSYSSVDPIFMDVLKHNLDL